MISGVSDNLMLDFINDEIASLKPTEKNDRILELLRLGDVALQARVKTYLQSRSTDLQSESDDAQDNCDALITALEAEVDALETLIGNL